MEINGPGHIHSAQPISTPHIGRVDRADTHGGFVAGGDEVSISREADLVARTHELPEIRHDRVAEIRAQIAAGAYETDAKLDLAVERLLDEIA
jgi:negative regulator of flagellin synthesis FlgM